MIFKLRAYIGIIRPLNFLIAFIAIFSGGLICGAKGNYDILIWAGFAGALVGAGGNIINDYFDVEIDKINRPERVLPSGKIAPRTALILYAAISSVALIISAELSFPLFIIVVSADILIFLYSMKFKGIPLAGNFIVSFITGFALIFGAAAVGDPACGIIPAFFAFIVNFIREVLKDIEDLDGDKQAGIFTFPARFGVSSAKRLILTLTLLLMLSTTIPYIFELYGIEYFVIIMIAVNTLFVYFLKKLFAPDFMANIRNLSSLLKLNMLLGIIAILAGNLL